ncbi:MAG TPA: aminotransferase class I/II-fold pyridoxal phosphate-dependent enzyme, partial [Gemmatimonadaceae bacterium]|nr:aminotransferase class I/II-fold pyridoxal phosphate-dependent enzyme [Gemmatimonadaceae bacterium]
MPPYASRFATLPEYPLAKIPQKKRELLARGVDVIDLGAGDADLDPPRAAVARMERAIHEPALGRYGFGMGHVPYREAVSAWMQQRFGVRFDPMTEIVPLIGSKEGISHLALAYLEPGAVGIIPEPGYNSYQGGTLLGSGEPYRYALRPRTNFLVELDEIPEDVLRRTRILYLNYPNNPTAAIAPVEYLERVVRTCHERDILLVYDNAYSELAFDGYVPPSIFEIEGAREVAIEFHSLSKTYNMTGWRCGWAAARPELAGTLAKVKSFVDTGQFMAVQAAGVAALNSWAEFVPRNVAVFKERRDAAVRAFRQAGFECEVPRATMYLWIKLPEGLPSAQFADRLLEEQGVVVMAGSAFGAGGEGFFRISFVTSPARIAEAAQRAGRL